MYYLSVSCLEHTSISLDRRSVVKPKADVELKVKVKRDDLIFSLEN